MENRRQEIMTPDETAEYLRIPKSSTCKLAQKGKILGRRSEALPVSQRNTERLVAPRPLAVAPASSGGMARQEMSSVSLSQQFVRNSVIDQTSATRKYKFSGHQTFPFRHGWLEKGARAWTTAPRCSRKRMRSSVSVLGKTWSTVLSIGVTSRSSSMNCPIRQPCLPRLGCG